MAEHVKSMRLAILVASLLVARAVHAAPEDDGPLGVTVQSDVMVPVGGGTQLSTDIYVPQGSAPYPVVVLRHGFGRSKSQFATWSHHLASRGLVVLVPNARSLTPDANQDSDDMLAVLAWAVTQNGQAGSTLFGRVDGSRRAVAGHSAGAWRLSSRRPRTPPWAPQCSWIRSRP